MKRVGYARIQQIIMSARAARGERRWTIASLLPEKDFRMEYKQLKKITWKKKEKKQRKKI